jgi:hypothetical protein
VQLQPGPAPRKTFILHFGGSGSGVSRLPLIFDHVSSVTKETGFPFSSSISAGIRFAANSKEMLYTSTHASTTQSFWKWEQAAETLISVANAEILVALILMLGQISAYAVEGHSSWYWDAHCPVGETASPSLHWRSHWFHVHAGVVRVIVWTPHAHGPNPGPGLTLKGA